MGRPTRNPDSKEKPMDEQEGTFTYVDLFAGIGGFAAALDAMGGRSVRAVEIDGQAAAVYKLNHGIDAFGDITVLANDDVVDFPDHDVLTAGFPCQPFSKSGAQRGMDETRGTLFWNILRILEAKRPKVVILENVRNLAGPRHRHEWNVIIKSLRELDYRVSASPAVFSPHLLDPQEGGAPQIRERVFITATYVPRLSAEHANPAPLVSMRRETPWDLLEDLPLARSAAPGYELTADETAWIDAWDDFREVVTRRMRRDAAPRNLDSVRLPGFPIWVGAWPRHGDLQIPPGTPRWKQLILQKNAELYGTQQDELEAWIERHGVDSFPASRQKFEWQAQQAESLWDCAMQFRPSGIRAKRMTHLPALVAITQTPVLGPMRRRLTIEEAARLQGLPSDFDFGDQPQRASYKQLGNGVNVGVVQYVLKQHLMRDLAWLGDDEWAHLRGLVELPYRPWRRTAAAATK